jgi:AcrR family transcriptional regulator
LTESVRWRILRTVSGITNTIRIAGSAADAPSPSRRAARREATRREIVDAAWVMVRAEGLAGLSMRTLGDAVGMRAQSIYSYFESKDAIYDALFRDGNEQFLEWMSPTLSMAADAPPLEIAAAAIRRYVEFCVADPVRHELLFQRTIPGFTPSAESYAVAVDALTQGAQALGQLGITDPEALDLWTAVSTGLVNQQLANDPGGDRWERLIDRTAHMLLVELAPHLLDAPRTAPRRTNSSRRRTS